MVTLDLNGSWEMKRTDKNEWIDVKVPGSVLNDLLIAGLIEDPFFRDNEESVKDIARFDYEYHREFQVCRELLRNDRILLCCEGLDTLAEVILNGQSAANTNNMHRMYEFDVKGLLREGTNSIRIVFYSPVEYIEKKQKENPLWGTEDAIKGFPHIRKAHYMFGWDWGPQIPDSGIWRNIYLKGYSLARLEDVYVTQQHENGGVSLGIRIRNEKWCNQPVDIEVSITAPDDSVMVTAVKNCTWQEHIRFAIENPQLWWPNGFGQQPLYKVDIVLRNAGSVLDSKTLNIGLRSMKIRKEKDPWGECFAFEVNGTAIFAMGANYIPEDNLLSRCTREKTERLIQDCIKGNFNCLRVWGGGIYPEDYFFDLCDRYGLIVWQDLMYACAVYDMNEEFAENIRRETIDNMKRIRHHASLGLWCGNNEMEVAWEEWGFPKTQKLRTDYIKQFEILLPQVAKEIDPNTFYWPSSPSSGGGFDQPNDENRGDVHYWDVWHGQKPFTDYKKFYFRFVSEFGFQSFPCLKTVEKFTLPEDRNIFSYVMECHQKNNAANGKILYYLSENFRYPKDFDSLLFTSQILQAEAIKYGVEHWRRNRGRCMGAIYWQLNDCWPVASWASMDSFGRWKALHYFAKRFYAPILLSASEEGTKAGLYVTNESLTPVKGNVLWRLRDNKAEILREGITSAEVAPLSSVLVESLDFADLIRDKSTKQKTCLEYSLEINGLEVSGGTVLFCKAKHFEFLKPLITFDVMEHEDRFVISLNSTVYTRYVELNVKGLDCVFSDNYFDLCPGTVKAVEIEKSRMSRKMELNEFINKLVTRSIFDIA